ncbi:MAG: hypothetical protein ABEN55_06020 [Bradymonadaceae bacterium]
MVFGLVSLLMTAQCASSPGPTGPDGAEGESAPLFELPEHWRLVDEKEGAAVYQANLQNRDGPGRILVGRLSLQDNDIRDLSVYLYNLNDSLVERIRGRADLDPFAQDRLKWSNGMIGYRTKMRGSLGSDAVILEGIAFSDGNYAYFHYGLFPESAYEQEREAYESLLASFRPLRGAEQKTTRGMNIAKAEDVTQQKDYGDGAESPDDYRPPKTHLGLVEWGTTRQTVRSQAGEPLRKGNRALGYQCQFLGLDHCVVIYIFTFDQLTHGGFIVENDYDTPQKYVSKYLRITKTLSQQYGKPKQSSAIWSDPKYRNEGAKWGKALTKNHVVFGTVWQKGPIKIVHSLRKGDNGKIEHRIMFNNEQLRSELQQKVQAQK